jgi:predicted esterase
MKITTIIWLLIVVSWLSGCSDSDSNNSNNSPPESGELTVLSAGVERTYYLIIPDDYDPRFFEEPLLFAYHGTGGSYDLWLNGFYDLLDAVGNDAIIVLMQALPDGNGVIQWNYEYDFEYFEDVLADVDRRVNFDPARVFVTGHSSGAGMAHELGCNYGDIIRGIAPHAGIMRSTKCVGAVAVFQTHGENDTLVPSGTGEGGHQFWVLYNGFEYDISGPGAHQSCIDHSLGGSPFPVQWCLHQEGSGIEAHDWPGFASESTWQFFSSLDYARPTASPPAGGGNARVGNSIDTTLSFTLRYPPGIVEPTQGAVSIYAAGTQQPVSGGPNSILNLSFDPGDVGPGSEKDYVVPIRYVTETFPGTYAFSVVMYVAAGGNPIPLPGHDHIVFHDVDIVDRNMPVFIDTVLVLEEVFY